MTCMENLLERPDKLCRSLNECWCNPTWRASLDARATAKVPKYFLHFLRQFVNGVASPVSPWRTNSYCLSQQPAALAALYENEAVLLAFEHLAMQDMKIGSE